MKVTFKFEKKGSVCTLHTRCKTVGEAVEEFEKDHPELETYTMHIDRACEAETADEGKEKHLFVASCVCASILLVLALGFSVITSLI